MLPSLAEYVFHASDEDISLDLHLKYPIFYDWGPWFWTPQLSGRTPYIYTIWSYWKLIDFYELPVVLLDSPES